jgi:hypothetical protein
MDKETEASGRIFVTFHCERVKNSLKQTGAKVDFVDVSKVMIYQKAVQGLNIHANVTLFYAVQFNLGYLLSKAK